ncbi:MAG: lytic transglycosylase domain-containing protein [Myxococcota bacterium]
MGSRSLLVLLVLCLSADGCLRPARLEAPAAPPRATANAPARLDPRVAQVRQRFSRYHTGLSASEIEILAHTLVEECRRHQVDPSLVLGVVQIESGFYNFAMSDKGALGLMQIMPTTGRAMARRLGVPWAGPETLFDPVVNVRLGIAYLAQLEANFGRMDVALAAYNWGPGRIGARLRRGEVLPRRYAENVLAAYGAHAARAARSESEWTRPEAGVLTSAATNPSTAAIAASSPAR